jgi:protein-L-isoaspartate(D-aspartate) O-methyltransferase
VTPAGTGYGEARRRMVAEQIARRGVRDATVLSALRAVPRHEFVPEGTEGQAYLDGPLPIGFGQTISQPYMVALMTELLAIDARSRVLEIGTGSGYQTAVLAEIVEEVWSIERVAPLAEQARARLRALGYDNVHIAIGDGSRGWPEHAPYDGVLSAAAPEHAPPALLDQLALGGRLVIPIGAPHRDQVLTIYRRSETGVESDPHTPCRFVPLVEGDEETGALVVADETTGGAGPTAAGAAPEGAAGGVTPMRSVRARVTGRVQGVYYRASALNEARRLGVAGHVKNLSDGSVEVRAQGARAAVDALLEWCRPGPPHAEVERVEVDDVEPEPGLDTFHVR